MKNILIIGAASAIICDVARLYAQEQSSFFLVARSQKKLKIISDDLIVRGAKSTKLFVMDALEFDKHEEMFSHCAEFFPDGVDIILIAHGSLPDQSLCDKNRYLSMKEFSVNCNSIISLSHISAEILEKQQYGTLAVLGSVAGLRGRKNNYIYGAAKSAVSTYLSGLRNRLANFPGIQILTVLPGFVSTPMTEKIPKNFLFSTTEKTAKDIVNGIKKKKDILYTPSFWRWIMLVVRAIPERLFKRMSI